MNTLPLPSLLSTVFFLLLLGYVISFMCWAHCHSAPGETTQRLRNATLFFGTWLAVSALIVLSRYAGPWDIVLVFVPLISLIIAAIAVALSPYGKRIALGVPLYALVGFHFFRLPLELIFFDWSEVGFIPIQMTYLGDNFDIITGVLALPVAVALWKHPGLRWLAWVFNIIGLTLLLRIFSIVALSSPTPMAARFGGYPVEIEIVEYLPYIWLPTVILPVALFTHIIIFRK